MLESCNSAQERWGGVHRLIDRWLQDRNALVGAFDSLQHDPQARTSTALQDFCQCLVDYVCAGHFEIYEQLLGEARAFNDRGALELADQVYPRLQALTEAALAFNDSCNDGACASDPRLGQRLIRLGELLHERFELEDCLIEVLHTAHQATTAAV